MTDLAALFARDPLSLTSDDIESIIKTMRDKRSQFNLDGTSAKVTPAKKPAKESALTAAGIDLKLDF